MSDRPIVFHCRRDLMSRCEEEFVRWHVSVMYNMHVESLFDPEIVNTG